jgi:hypothetical protein
MFLGGGGRTGDVVVDVLNTFSESGGRSGDGEATCLGIVEETCEAVGIDRDERAVPTGVKALGDYKIY